MTLQTKLEAMGRIYPLSDNAEVAAEKKKGDTPCKPVDKNDADHNDVHDPYYDRPPSNNENIKDRDIFDSKKCLRKIKEYEEAQVDYDFRERWSNAQELSYDDFLQLPSDQQRRIFDGLRSIFDRRSSEILENIASHTEERRCMDGVHPFMVHIFGDLNIRVSYRLAYTLRMVTVIYSSTIEQLYRFLCGKEFSSVETSMAALLDLSRDQRLLLLALKPAARSHAIASSLLRGRGNQYLQEYDSLESLTHDIRYLIFQIIMSDYPLRAEWALGLELSRIAMTSRINIGIQRVIRRLGSNNFSLRQMWHFIPRGSTGGKCIHGKYTQRCPLCNVCTVEGCTTAARGNTGKCINHGGGPRCTVEGCTKGAQGNTGKCINHGGGPHCTVKGCTKAARGNTGKCIKHGGGPRCTVEGCNKAARGNTGKCIKHGGGSRCTVEGCNKAARGNTGFCYKHRGSIKPKPRPSLRRFSDSDSD